LEDPARIIDAAAVGIPLQRIRRTWPCTGSWKIGFALGGVMDRRLGAVGLRFWFGPG
jgi:hypothetical protein